MKTQLQALLAETRANELITASTMFAPEDRLTSIQLFGEIMTELNEPAAALAENPGRVAA